MSEVAEAKEETVWVHTGKVKLQTSSPNLVYRCTNCKRGIHSYVDDKQGIVVRCTKTSVDMCECKCRTHFQCEYGKIHAYSTLCKCEELENPKRKPTPELDKIVAEANLYYQQQRKIMEGRKYKPEEVK